MTDARVGLPSRASAVGCEGAQEDWEHEMARSDDDVELGRAEGGVRVDVDEDVDDEDERRVPKPPKVDKVGTGWGRERECDYVARGQISCRRSYLLACSHATHWLERALAFPVKCTLQDWLLCGPGGGRGGRRARRGRGRGGGRQWR